MASISKTYTKARIQRTCMFILLQIKKVQMQENNHFNHVIVSGFDSVGQEFLKGKHVITKFKELPKFLQDIELKCQYLSFDTFKARKVMYYDCMYIHLFFSMYPKAKETLYVRTITWMSCS